MTPSPRREKITNRLLLALPEASLKRLRPELELLHMAKGEVLDRPDHKIEHLYFVNRGIVSIVKTMLDGRTVEIGVVGIEGVTDPNTLFGIDRATLETIVQIPGSVFRISRDRLRREVEREPRLRTLMQGYARFALAQLAQTAACNRLHSLEARCCRWLLLAHDSARADTFPLTHEYLAMMLGVQRAGISIAASFLRKAGIIDYVHGEVTVIDRAGLEEAACECYRAMRADFDHLVLGRGD